MQRVVASVELRDTPHPDVPVKKIINCIQHRVSVGHGSALNCDTGWRIGLLVVYLVLVFKTTMQQSYHIIGLTCKVMPPPRSTIV